MGLPNLLVPPPGEDGWREYWFYHYQDHLEIVQALSKLGFAVSNYIIDPWVNEDKDGILERHQQFHNEMNAIMGIAGADLSDVDFRRENEVRAWVYLNYQDHLSAHVELNI
jgi:hypothetical protein